MSPPAGLESHHLVARSPKPLHQLTRSSLVVFELVKPSFPSLQALSTSAPSSTPSSPRYLASPPASYPSTPVLDRRSSASSTSSSTDSACSELMQSCLDTLDELLREETEATKPGLSRRPSRLTTEQVEIWNQVVEKAR